MQLKKGKIRLHYSRVNHILQVNIVYLYGERISEEIPQDYMERKIGIKQYQTRDFIQAIIFVMMGILMIFGGLYGLLKK
ncbi:hypothetical protein IGI01_20665 [Bacillus thuringiensis]|nr:hypothetical protein [Bacillus thuringiensis]